MARKRMTRSQSEKMIGGVCGGMANYFQVDPVVVRLIVVLLTLSTGVGFFAYLLFWGIIPMESPHAALRDDADNTHDALPMGSPNKIDYIDHHGGDSFVLPPPASPTHFLAQQPLSPHQRWYKTGKFLIAIGILVTLDLIGLKMSVFLPFLLIVVVVVVLARKR